MNCAMYVNNVTTLKRYCKITELMTFEINFVMYFATCDMISSGLYTKEKLFYYEKRKKDDFFTSDTEYADIDACYSGG